jgi:hypothetical protein
MTEFEAKTVSLLTDISESLAVISGRKKPYDPTFLETYGFGDTTPEYKRGAGTEHGDTT